MIAVALMLALVTQQLLLLPIIKLQRAADAISRHENLSPPILIAATSWGQRREIWNECPGQYLSIPPPQKPRTEPSRIFLRR